MRLAVVQSDVEYGDPHANVGRLVAEVERLGQQRVDLAVFPEAFLTGYCADSRDEALRIALPPAWDTRTQQELDAGMRRPGADIWEQVESVVGRTGVGVVAGYASKVDTVLSNSATMWLPGRAPVTYRKTHLPFLGMDRFASPGSYLPIFETPWGKVGILICYDLRPPEPSRTLALEGADLILLPTNWPRTQTAEHYTIVRSSENKIFLAACNRVGTERGTTFVGLSGIYDPYGEALAKAGDGEETLIVDIDLSLARDKRNVIEPGEYELDLWGCRQPELYRVIGKSL